MTNTVLALCDLAKKAGYKSLFGLTIPDNQRSQNVLIRAGFTMEGEMEKDGKRYIKFTKNFKEK